VRFEIHRASPTQNVLCHKSQVNSKDISGIS
jgi:hypothetical protein